MLAETKTWVCICFLHSLLCYPGDRRLCQNLAISSSTRNNSLLGQRACKPTLALYVILCPSSNRNMKGNNYSLPPLFSCHLFFWMQSELLNSVLFHGQHSQWVLHSALHLTSSAILAAPSSLLLSFSSTVQLRSFQLLPTKTGPCRAFSPPLHAQLRLFSSHSCCLLSTAPVGLAGDWRPLSR